MTSTPRPYVRFLLAAAGVAAASLATAPAALAIGGPDERLSPAKSPRVIERAMCGPIATKLKIKPENGRMEVEYELDQNVNGRTWRLALASDGSRVATASRTTQAPSGSLHWRVVTADVAGVGTFTVTARSGSTTCRISASM